MGERPTSIAVADFNEDKILDLAVTNEDSANVSILLGNGDGTFRSASNAPVGNKPSSLAVEDFNEDAIPDLAVTNRGSDSLSVLIAKGHGTFRAPQNIMTGRSPVGVVVADFNSGPDAAQRPGDEPYRLFASVSIVGLGVASFIVLNPRYRTTRNRCALQSFHSFDEERRHWSWT